MSLINHIKVGDKVFCKRNGCDITITQISPYEPRLAECQGFNHPKPFTHIIVTSHGWYTEMGEYGGDAESGICLVLKGIEYFKPIAKSESELHEFTNLFKDEAEAKSFVASLGFEYVGKGSTVLLPFKE